MANQWLREFEDQIAAKTAHTFLFYGNVADNILYEGDFLRPYQVIPRLATFEKTGIIAFFNLASGVRFVDEEMRRAFLHLVIKPIVDRINKSRPPDAQFTSEEYFELHKHEILHVLDWFEALLLFAWKTVSETTREFPERVEKYLKNKAPKISGVPFAVVVFEYLESKTPPESATGSSQLDRRVVETFQWWSQLPEIRKTDNLIVLISDFLSGIAPQLHDQAKGIVPIAVPLPDREEQKETIEAFEAQGIYIPVKGEKGELAIDEVARLTAGLSRVELAQIFKQAHVHKESLTSTLLFDKKSKIIQARLGDIVRMRKPAWGWESIGGMDDRVALAMMWAEAMRRGNVGRMPKGGIILVGAPGTGKTVFAEAFAHELDMPFMEVMNTFNQFVGVSEQNMQNLLDTAWALRPCVLFFDEVEQLLLPRGGVYHGDSGVFARSSRMLMQFFSDPRIHGQVVIFAATNRPDLLDEAMKRAGRFGAKIPFLIPKKEDRPSIWKALLRKEVIRLALSSVELDISQVVDDEKAIAMLSEMADFWENKNGLLMYGPPNEDEMIGGEEDVIPMTGAEMEDIIGLAFQPFLSDADRAQLRNLSSEERVKLLLEKFPMENRFVITAQALQEAMRNYLPHEDVRTYKAMNDLAILSVNDLRFIPEAYRDYARKLRGTGSPRK